MHQIAIQYAVAKKIPGSTLLRRWANAALSLKSPTSELTIRVVSIDEMTALNSTYRKKNGPTNVLAFPFIMPDVMQSDVSVIGDIIICADVVNREAKEQNKKIKAHWAHMVVHGTLHLLGYDHINEKDALIMEAKEIEILKALNFPDPYQLNEKGNNHG